MAERVAILNRAAALIGAERIRDPEVAGQGRARRLIELYETVYDEALGVWPWVCARERAMIATSNKVPAWGFANAFALPGQAVQVAAACTGGAPWEVEGRRILTDASGPLKVMLISRVPESHLHPLIAYYVAARLARAAVMGVSESTTLQERVKGFQEDAFFEAVQAENAQGGSLQSLGSDWVLAMQTASAPELTALGASRPSSWME